MWGNELSGEIYKSITEQTLVTVSLEHWILGSMNIDASEGGCTVIQKVESIEAVWLFVLNPFAANFKSIGYYWVLIKYLTK